MKAQLLVRFCINSIPQDEVSVRLPVNIFFGMKFLPYMCQSVETLFNIVLSWFYALLKMSSKVDERFIFDWRFFSSKTAKFLPKTLIFSSYLKENFEMVLYFNIFSLKLKEEQKSNIKRYLCKCSCSEITFSNREWIKSKKFCANVLQAELWKNSKGFL